MQALSLSLSLSVSLSLFLFLCGRILRFPRMYPSIRLSSPRGISSTNCTTNPAEQLESSCFARANCLILAAGNEESKLFSLSSFDFIEQGALVSIRKEKLRNFFPFVNVFVILVSVFNVSRNEGFIFCDSVYSTDKTVYIILVEINFGKYSPLLRNFSLYLWKRSILVSKLFVIVEETDIISLVV